MKCKASDDSRILLYWMHGEIWDVVLCRGLGVWFKIWKKDWIRCVCLYAVVSVSVNDITRGFRKVSVSASWFIHLCLYILEHFVSLFNTGGSKWAFHRFLRLFIIIEHLLERALLIVQMNSVRLRFWNTVWNSDGHLKPWVKWCRTQDGRMKCEGKNMIEK